MYSGGDPREQSRNVADGLIADDVVISTSRAIRGVRLAPDEAESLKKARSALRRLGQDDDLDQDEDTQSYELASTEIDALQVAFEHGGPFLAELADRIDEVLALDGKTPEDPTRYDELIDFFERLGRVTLDRANGQSVEVLETGVWPVSPPISSS